MTDFIDWLARAGGASASILIILGFMFREKWKQVLARAMATDVERLKAELAKSQADHAASLTPQLEAIKHDFQQKLEAYKVTLIAEAEAAKAKSDLRKSIALRFAEIQFERLVDLEGELGPIYSRIAASASIEVESKAAKDQVESMESLNRLSVATDRAEMFIPLDDRMELLKFRGDLLALTSDCVGVGKPKFEMASERGNALGKAAVSTHSKVKARIVGMGSV